MARFGDSLIILCLKNFNCLFSSMESHPSTPLTDPSQSKGKNQLGRKEIAYTMLDLLFLLGNPRKSATLLDPPIIRKNEAGLEEVIIEKEVGGLYKDQVVALDRTTQLLTSTAIAIADILKQKASR